MAMGASPATSTLRVMRDVVRKVFTHPVLALGSTLLWGIVEVGALLRSRFARDRSHVG